MSLESIDFYAGSHAPHRLYATLLDGWLRCDSKAVLGARFEPVKLLRKG